LGGEGKYDIIGGMKEIKRVLGEVIEKLFGGGILERAKVEISEAPEGTGADYATNVAFLLAREAQRSSREIALAKETQGGSGEMTPAKEARRSPREIAEELAEEIRAREPKIGVEVAGAGFLNFISPDEYFYREIEEIRADVGKKSRENISQDEYSGKTVVCEFSDPNPFKVLHVGHLYTSVVGDAIARLIENAGARVVRANFGGDVGLHVAKTLYALTASRSSASADARLAHRTLSTARSDAPASLNSIDAENALDAENDLTIEKIAEAYVAGTRAYEEDESAKAEITKLNKEIYRINKENVHEGELAELYWRGREVSYKYFEDFYASIGVKFDKYYPESTVAGRGLMEVLKHKPEVYEESEGATVFRGEKYGLHTRVFVNKEGLPTYEAKDVGLIFSKYDDYKFDESIVITGNDIVDYMKVVLKSIEQYAPELVARTRHITHGNVRLPGNVKMSSRKGNFIKAVEVLEMVEATVSRSSASAGAGAVGEIALAAVKYGFLKYRIGGDIEFDIDECASTTGNSGVYLLYSTVRARKILAACGAGEMEGEYMYNIYERNLVKKIAQYPEAVAEATREMAPSKLCQYLYEVAQEFSRFYEKVKVAGSEKEGERKKIVEAYERVLTNGLGLLGIKVPEEM